MKTHISIFISVCISLSILSAQTMDVVPKTSTLNWKGYGEIGNFSQSGMIEVKEGQINMIDGLISSGFVLIDMKSISAEDKKLVGHLKNKDFFDVKKYPIARLHIMEINENQVSGLLQIRDKTREVSFEILQEKLGDAVHVKGMLCIDRTQFDIKYNSSSYFQNLGNYAIKNEFDLEFELVFE